MSNPVFPKWLLNWFIASLCGVFIGIAGMLAAVLVHNDKAFLICDLWTIAFLLSTGFSIMVGRKYT